MKDQIYQLEQIVVWMNLVFYLLNLSGHPGNISKFFFFFLVFIEKISEGLSNEENGKEKDNVTEKLVKL